jgi:glycosyltransferase involved in cell wall biosynthesis
MACGVPVLAANAAALPEVVGQAGILFDPRAVASISAAITRVLSDESLRAVLSERGLKRAGQFTWERAARETGAVLREAALA